MAREWDSLSREERAQVAREMVLQGDLEGLGDLLLHYLRTWGRAGANLSANTARSYLSAVRLYWRWLKEHYGDGAGQVAANPSEEVGAAFLRDLEAGGMRPASLNQRRAALRALYEALRWAGVLGENPFERAPVRRDPVPRHEKRMPYSEDEVKRLLEVAGAEERILVLLGAQGGLRISEAVRLRWEDVDLAGRRMRVLGKGRKEATVLIPKALAEALEGVPQEGRTGPVLPWRSDDAARKALRALCHRAGVPYRGYHALRHYCGTHLYRATRDLQTVARHLRHSGIATSSIYAKWAEDQVRGILDSWGA